MAAVAVVGSKAQDFPTPSSADMGVAFIHATVIDGTGAQPVPGMTILIKNGRIRVIADDHTVRIPAGTHVEDLHGRYVIPGLIDSHVHLGTIERDDDAQRAILKFAVLGGVTTVRDMGGSLQRVRAAAHGPASDPAPRVYYSAIM